MVKWTALALILGFLIDLSAGDPRWLYHPVRVIGNGISFLEKGLRKIFPDTPGGERIAGLFLVILISVFGGGIPLLLLYGAYHVHTGLGLALETFWCYQMIAAKSLKKESMRVSRELEKGNLEGARYAVSMIVGRDTENLTPEGITKAAVETVAENTSDGVIAPLFYMALGGAPLLFFYKSVNTMDSMVGYKNEKYLNFGRYAAKLDDAVNYLPSRISAWLMIAVSYMGGFDGKNAGKIFFRDRYNHASPNSAQTEAVMAGALHVQLAGDAWYFGRLYEKPTIGEADRPIEYEDIRRANCLLYRSAVLGAFLFAALRMGIMAVIAMC